MNPSTMSTPNALATRSGPSLREARTIAHAQAMAPFLFQAARAARDLGVLRAVRARPVSADEVARTAALPMTSVEALLDACLAGNLVTEITPESWHLTTIGEVWLLDSQLAADTEFTHDVCWGGLADLSQALRTAQPAGLARLGPWPTIYAGLAHLPPAIRASWFTYDHFHSDSAFPAALSAVHASNPQTLLDVGGNTGRFSRLALTRLPMVHVTLLDLPSQVREAETNLADFTGRITCTGLDLLDHQHPFPGSMDAVWMSQFLDCFSPADVVALLRRARAALAPGGSVWVLEVCPDRQSEPAAATSLRLASLYFTALANGVSRFYRATTYRHLAAQAGLEIVSEIDGLGTAHTLFRLQPLVAVPQLRSVANCETAV